MGVWRFESGRAYLQTIAPNVTNPQKGGPGRVRGSDVRFIPTVDHHSGTLFDDWRTIASPHSTDAVCPNCGGRNGSDPSAMLGLVLVLVANTAVVAALVAAVIWTLA